MSTTSGASRATASRMPDHRSAGSIVTRVPRRPMRSWRGLMPALTVSATLAAPALAVDPPSTGLPGTTLLQFRLRVESVDEAAFRETAPR